MRKSIDSKFDFICAFLAYLYLLIRISQWIISSNAEVALFIKCLCFLFILIGIIVLYIILKNGLFAQVKQKEIYGLFSYVGRYIVRMILLVLPMVYAIIILKDYAEIMIYNKISLLIIFVIFIMYCIFYHYLPIEKFLGFYYCGYYYNYLYVLLYLLYTCVIALYYLIIY